MLYPYDPKANYTPVFDKFINYFCGGHQNRKNYIRSILYTIVFIMLKFQVFIYIFGPGASGKSMFTNLLMPLLGEQSVISTTLQALSSDQFEVINLSGKKLVFINDTPGMITNTHTIKAYSGQDSLRRRAMHTQGTYNVTPESIIVAVGNDPLVTQDVRNAIKRRMRAFETSIVSTECKYLIIRKKYNIWEKPLSKELPGIFN